MRVIKRYLVPVMAVVLIMLVLIASAQKDRFELSGSETLPALLYEDKMIDSAEINKAVESGRGLVLVDGEKPGPELSGLPTLQIEFRELGSKKLRRFAGSLDQVLIYAGDDLVANQAWIILTQMGFENVRILGNKSLKMDEKASFRFMSGDPEDPEGSEAL